MGDRFAVDGCLALNGEADGTSGQIIGLHRQRCRGDVRRLGWPGRNGHGAGDSLWAHDGHRYGTVVARALQKDGDGDSAASGDIPAVETARQGEVGVRGREAKAVNFIRSPQECRCSTATV